MGGHTSSQGESTVAEASSTAFDVLVLGGGSGGYATALRASQLGLTVGVVEEDKLGGTCLHNGCIPTKALLHAAEVADTAREGHAIGVQSSVSGIDMAAVNTYKQGVVDRLYKGLQGPAKSRGAWAMRSASSTSRSTACFPPSSPGVSTSPCHPGDAPRGNGPSPSSR